MTYRPCLVVAVLLALGAPAVRGQTPPAVVPFTIQVPDADLIDLKQRLARTRFPDEIVESGWTYGTNLTYLKELVTYWQTTFDWRAQERKLNAFDQFKTTIDGLEVHFIHQRSKEPGAMPLVLSHGWPGSIFEFTKVIGPLTDPVKFGGRPQDAFHVVALSLPGFGFSGRPREPGYSPERMAGVIAKLMAALGYTRYGVQGGDWGAIIGPFVAIHDAPHVAGLHLNMCSAGPPAGMSNPSDGVPAAELARMKSLQDFMANERGYSQIQGTRPQTLGYGLNDSPAGLAAWIVEKFRAFSDSKGNIESRFTKDELLTNVMIYWVTQTITSSARLYFESQRAPAGQRRVELPTACAIFPGEVVYSPRKYIEARFNLTRWTEMPSGGHYAALEEPQLFADDVRAFFRGLR